MNPTVIELAKKLMSIPSTAGNAEALREVLSVTKKELDGTAFTPYEKEGVPSVLFFNTRSIPTSFRVILNAHLDVVPGSASQFVPRVDGDRLIGRGAYDMKAAAAVELAVFREAAKKVSYPLGLQLVTDEETGGFNGTKCQVTEGVRAEFVVVGECSSNLSVGTESKGMLWQVVTFKGMPAHGAYPWNGKNAVLQAGQFLNDLIKRFPIPEKATWQTTVNVGSVETPNKTFNKVPDECKVRLDIRYIPSDSKTILADIASLVPKSASTETILFEPAHTNDADNSFLKSLTTAITAAGKSGESTRMHGGSDLRHFNSPGVEFGPVGAGHHTDDEWVSIQSLSEYYEILLTFLLSLDRK